ncbi:MAG: hypothetical protein AABY22_34535, partial [Nanoarchaeota archaeon]
KLESEEPKQIEAKEGAISINVNMGTAREKVEEIAAGVARRYGEIRDMTVGRVNKRIEEKKAREEKRKSLLKGKYDKY